MCLVFPAALQAGQGERASPGAAAPQHPPPCDPYRQNRALLFWIRAKYPCGDTGMGKIPKLLPSPGSVCGETDSMDHIPPQL